MDDNKLNEIFLNLNSKSKQAKSVTTTLSMTKERRNKLLAKYGHISKFEDDVHKIYLKLKEKEKE